MEPFIDVLYRIAGVLAIGGIVCVPLSAVPFLTGLHRAILPLLYAAAGCAATALILQLVMPRIS